MPSQELFLRLMQNVQCCFPLCALRRREMNREGLVDCHDGRYIGRRYWLVGDHELGGYKFVLRYPLRPCEE